MLFSEQDHLTQYGYYKVGDIKTFCKHEAFLFANHDISKIEYIFNDEVYSQYDWTQEPSEDLYSLFDERAKQLRSNYDYIILFYSSGTDSQTILDTFLRNNLRIDELCSLYHQGPKVSFINDEIYSNVIPLAKKLNIKLKLIDCSPELLNLDHNDIEFISNHSLSKFYIVRDSHIIKKRMMQEYDDLIKKGKKICLIWGYEKPRIFYDSENKSYNFKFFDISTNHAIGYMFHNTPIVDENFFWSKDCPKIIIKHCHQVKNVLLKIPKESHLLCSFDDLPNGGPYFEHSEGKYLNYESSIKVIYPKLLYDKTQEPRLKFGKTIGRIFTQADRWLIESNHESQIKFYSKIKSLSDNYRNYFIRKYNTLYSIKLFYTKSYTIHKLEN